MLTEENIFKLRLIDVITNRKDKDFILKLFSIAGIIISEEETCSTCQIGKLKKKKNMKSKLRISYYCDNRNCRKEKSLFKNSFFENKNLNAFIVCFSNFIAKKTVSSIVKDMGINEKTVTKYYKIIREKISNFMDTNILVLGGENVEVEIDETHLFTRKYNRGNILASQSIWVFGILERVTKRVYLETVLQRNGQTLFNIVQNHLSPGTIIYSDSWRGYNIIKTEFEVLSVNHKLCFVDPDNPNIHTNNIERLWRSLKEGMRGVSVTNYQAHLNEFMYRRQFFVGNFGTDLIALLRLFS